jgi:prepilin-type N-terminal cleavage/methylation domain-containing protein
MKNKKGFTLLELMLSIAIILIISGLLVGLIVAIKDGYMTVYNQNDSADYALL